MYDNNKDYGLSHSKAQVKSTLVSRNITINGHRTSVRLEPEMWTALKEISKREKCTIHDICSLISLKKTQNTSLTAAIRVFLMLYYRSSSTEAGHTKAGHGNIMSMRARAQLDEAERTLGVKKTKHRMFRSQISQAPEMTSTYYQ